MCILKKVNINGNKYFTLVPTDESKDTIKKYEEIWSKIRDLIRSVINRVHHSKVNMKNKNNKIG